jgi:hypothetical protein
MVPSPTRQAPTKSHVAVVQRAITRGAGTAPYDSIGVDTAMRWPILVCLVHR